MLILSQGRHSQAVQDHVVLSGQLKLVHINHPKISQHYVTAQCNLMNFLFYVEFDERVKYFS